MSLNTIEKSWKFACRLDAFEDITCDDAKAILQEWEDWVNKSKFGCNSIEMLIFDRYAKDEIIEQLERVLDEQAALGQAQNELIAKLQQQVKDLSGAVLAHEMFSDYLQEQFLGVDGPSHWQAS